MLTPEIERSDKKHDDDDDDADERSRAMGFARREQVVFGIDRSVLGHSTIVHPHPSGAFSKHEGDIYLSNSFL